MATLKEEQERIRSLLLDTVTLLCKNGLTFRKQLKVQGLLGITLDEDNVFIVHFDENLGEVTVEAADKCPSSTSENDTVKNTPRERRTDRKRKAMVDVSEEPEEKIHIKSESNDDVVFLEDQPDVKPVHIQALPSFQSEAMYTNYAQLPLNQPPQVIPNVMNSNVPTTFSPGTLHSPSNLQPHGAMAFPDPSATIPQQMTPEKMLQCKFSKAAKESGSCTPSKIYANDLCYEYSNGIEHKSRSCLTFKAESVAMGMQHNHLDNCYQKMSYSPTDQNSSQSNGGFPGSSILCSESEDIKEQGFKPYMCQECGRSYKTRDNLVRHSKSHLYPGKPRCSKCTLYFPDEDALEKHNIENHALVFSCSLCPFTTRRKKMFQDHLVSHDIAVGDLDLTTDSQDSQS